MSQQTEQRHPRRIQRKRTKGWKMPSNTVYVGRPTKFGNPYWDVKRYGVNLCVAIFRSIADGSWDPTEVRKLIADSFLGCGCPNWDAVFDSKTELWARWMYAERNDWLKALDNNPTEVIQRELRGKDLACWCPLDQPCHADVLLELAND